MLQIEFSFPFDCCASRRSIPAGLSAVLCTTLDYRFVARRINTDAVVPQRLSWRIKNMIRNGETR